MCFDKETSLSIFLFGTSCSIYLAYRGICNKSKDDICNSVILFLVSLMQLIEYFLWKYPTCNIYNQIASISIILVLYLQPVILYYTYKFLNKKKLDKKSSLVHNSIILFFTFLCIYFIIYLSKNKRSICSFKDPNGCRLVWEPFKILLKNKKILFLIALFLYFYIYLIIPRNVKVNKIYELLPKVSLIITLLISIYKKGKYFYTTFGSMWCFIAVFFGIFAILNI